MKKTMVTFTLILCVFYTSGQTIDVTALDLLQKSWDKLAVMKNISYRMTEVDTMIRENQFLYFRNTVFPIVEFIVSQLHGFKIFLTPKFVKYLVDFFKLALIIRGID
jgi:hypothetical protein